MGAFVKLYGGAVDRRTRRRWGAVCRRLVEGWTDRELGEIAIGMRKKFPWSEGEPFDPFDFERHGAKALALARGGFGSEAEANDRAWEERARAEVERAEKPVAGELRA